MKKVILALGCLVTGCSDSSASTLRCADIEEDVVRISDGNVIKIVDEHETTRSAKQLVCHGTGYLRDGRQPMIRYRAWYDEDGEVMVAWDTDEADQAVWQENEKTAIRENAKAERRFEQEVDRIVDQAE